MRLKIINYLLKCNRTIKRMNRRMYNKSQRRKKSKKFIRKLFENQRYINCLNKKRKERWLNSK